MKPYLRDSLNSVLAQTRKDFEVILVDSGQWIGKTDQISLDIAAIHAEFSGHPLIHWVTTGEPPDIRQRKCPIAWANNETIRAGLVRGRYVCTFYDDDVYDPRFMEMMAGFLDAHPEEKAVWCSQLRVRMDREGNLSPAGIIMADHAKSGRFCGAVDGAQIMFRREVLDLMGDPWLDEDDLGNCHQSDGVFLDKLSEICAPVPNIPDVLLDHRFTPISAYHPS